MSRSCNVEALKGVGVVDGNVVSGRCLAVGANCLGQRRDRSRLDPLEAAVISRLRRSEQGWKSNGKKAKKKMAVPAANTGR